MRRSTGLATTFAVLSVAGLGVTANLIGPLAVRGEATVVVTTAPCGDVARAGCFDPKRPNEIQVIPGARPATIAHENLHRDLYGSFDLRWDDECYVSTLLYDTTGLEDGYVLLGLCDD